MDHASVERNDQYGHTEKMKRSLEENRKSENLIEVTLYDEYTRMYAEYERLRRYLGRKPDSPQIAAA